MGMIVIMCCSARCSRLPFRLTIIFLGFFRMISLYRPGVIVRRCVSRMAPRRSVSAAWMRPARVSVAVTLRLW
jgi:hypothetical protein